MWSRPWNFLYVYYMTMPSHSPILSTKLLQPNIPVLADFAVSPAPVRGQCSHVKQHIQSVEIFTCSLML